MQSSRHRAARKGVNSMTAGPPCHVLARAGLLEQRRGRGYLVRAGILVAVQCLLACDLVGQQLAACPRKLCCSRRCRGCQDQLLRDRSDANRVGIGARQ